MAAGISLFFALIAITGAAVSIWFGVIQSRRDVRAATRDLRRHTEELEHELAAHRQ